MRCYSCRKYDDCELPWKCSSTMYDCSAYELEQTNEEWIKSCDTEQLAEWIVEILFFDNRLKKHIHDMGYINMHGYKTEMVEWLKQPHTNE